MKREGETRTLRHSIRKGQANFFEDIRRRKGLEHLVTIRKIDGKRSRGRQREKFTDGLRNG